MNEETEILERARRGSSQVNKFNSLFCKWKAIYKNSTATLRGQVHIYNNNIILNCNADYPQVLTAYIYI